MHCPDCGTRATADQKFCRTCGFSLEKVAQLLAEQSSVITTDQMPEENITHLQNRLKKLERLGLYGVVGLCATLIGGLFWGIISKMILERGKVIGGSLLIAFFLVTISLVLLMIYIETRRKMIADRKPHQPTLHPVTEATNPLPPESYPHSPVSVAEHTTARLEERTKTAS